MILNLILASPNVPNRSAKLGIVKRLSHEARLSREMKRETKLVEKIKHAISLLGDNLIGSSDGPNNSIIIIIRQRDPQSFNII